MKTLKEIKEERAGLKKEMVSIHEKASTEKRDMSAEENTKFDELFDKNTTLEKEERRLESLNQIKIELNQPVKESDPAGETKEERKVKEDKVFRKFLRYGHEALTPEDRKIWIPKEERATTDPQTVTTTGGGYTIPTTLENYLTVALLAYGGAREAGKIIKTAGGGSMDFPTIDDTSIKGRLLSINTAFTVNNMTFGKATSIGYKFSSDALLIPNELLEDEAVSLESTVYDLLAERVARIENDYFTTGTGSSQPQGCQYGGTSSGVAPAVAAITKANMEDLMFSIDPAYRKSKYCMWMFNDSTAKALFKLSLGTYVDIPLFTNGLNGPGNSGWMADKIFGFPYVINQSMPSIGAGLKSVLFGDFSRFMIRDIAGFKMLRLVERYAEYDQIALCLLHRSDSRVLTSSALKYMTHANT